MKVSIASDHAGLETKNKVVEFLKEKGYEPIDCGTYTPDSCDYPIFAKEAARKVASGEVEFGVLICSSGEGIMIAANKVPGIRCGLAYNNDVARLTREHNNANMIAFGASFMSVEEIEERVLIFLTTPFSNAPRHAHRVELMEK